MSDHAVVTTDAEAAHPLGVQWYEPTTGQLRQADQLEPKPGEHWQMVRVTAVLRPFDP